jgi:hypothetical protein
VKHLKLRQVQWAGTLLARALLDQQEHPISYVSRSLFLIIRNFPKQT